MTGSTDPQAAAAAEAAAAAAAAAEAATAAKAKVKTIPVRVLQTCEHGNVDDVVDLHSKVAQAAEKVGFVDTHKDAVAYARSLPGNSKNV